MKAMKANALGDAEAAYGPSKREIDNRGRSVCVCVCVCVCVWQRERERERIKGSLSLSSCFFLHSYFCSNIAVSLTFSLPLSLSLSESLWRGSRPRANILAHRGAQFTYLPSSSSAALSVGRELGDRRRCRRFHYRNVCNSVGRFFCLKKQYLFAPIKVYVNYCFCPF